MYPVGQSTPRQSLPPGFHREIRAKKIGGTITRRRQEGVGEFLLSGGARANSAVGEEESSGKTPILGDSGKPLLY